MEASLGPYATACQLQQRPAPRAGGMFETIKILPIENIDKSKIVASVRYWDKAGTQGAGCRTAGSLVHKMSDGTYIIADMIKGQWMASEREKRIKQCALLDGPGVVIWMEQEPGSGGKESAESSIRNLAGYKVYADRVTGSKEARAEPYAAQMGGGNIRVLNREWTREFMQEHQMFPNGKYKDQVDSTAGAFNKLTATKKSAGTW